MGRSREDVVERGGGDGARELLEVDAPVAVGVSLLDHPRELLDGERVAEPGHGVRELGRGDEPVAVAVEDGEEPAELVLGVGGAVGEEVGCHERDELGELDEAVGVGVGAGDERVELVGAGRESQGPEQGPQLQLRQAAVGVAVEGAEDLPELRQLVVVQPGLLLLRRRLADGGGHGGAAPPDGLRRRGGRWLVRGGVDGGVSGGGVAHVGIGRRGRRRGGGHELGGAAGEVGSWRGWRPGMADQEWRGTYYSQYERARARGIQCTTDIALFFLHPWHGTAPRAGTRDVAAGRSEPETCWKGQSQTRGAQVNDRRESFGTKAHASVSESLCNYCRESSSPNAHLLSWVDLKSCIIVASAFYLFI